MSFIFVGSIGALMALLFLHHKFNPMKVGKNVSENKIMNCKKIDLQEDCAIAFKDLGLEEENDILYFDGRKMLISKDGEPSGDVADMELLIYDIKEDVSNSIVQLQNVNMVIADTLRDGFFLFSVVCIDKDGREKKWEIEVDLQKEQANVYPLKKSIGALSTSSANIGKELFLIYAVSDNKDNNVKTILTKINNNKYNTFASCNYSKKKKEGDVIKAVWTEGELVYLYISDDTPDGTVKEYDKNGIFHREYAISLKQFLDLTGVDNMIGYDTISGVTACSGYICFYTYNHRICVMKKSGDSYQEVKVDSRLSDLLYGASLIPDYSNSPNYMFFKEYMSDRLVVFDLKTQKCNNIKIKTKGDIKSSFFSEGSLYFCVRENDISKWYQYKL
ncbi:hypothetical protein D7V86_16930 [bacterium D16-51]|nr:hypothetical protein D7V96_11985 [bacterium D16-59]RKI57698.1 hypothetical protein D7V86_16930 [bacterium D16-51]